MAEPMRAAAAVKKAAFIVNDGFVCMYARSDGWLDSFCFFSFREYNYNVVLDKIFLVVKSAR